MNNIRITTVLAGIAMLFAVDACTVPSEVPKQQASIPAPLTIAQDGPCCGPITPKAQHILDVLDASNVEILWHMGTRVEWDTGKPDGSGITDNEHNHTHCAAFAAAMSQRLGIYMLRPPYHPQLMLATAQGKWLRSTSATDTG